MREVLSRLPSRLPSVRSLSLFAISTASLFDFILFSTTLGQQP